MKRGFSLTEMLVSMAVGALVLAGALQFSAVHQRIHSRLQGKILTDSSVDTARLSLSNLLRNREPVFWSVFPMIQQPVHETDHQHNAFQVTRLCPLASTGSCLVFWDLVPPNEDYGFYEVMPLPADDWALSLTPLEERFPQITHRQIEASSVLLFVTNEQAVPRLVSEVLPDRVRLGDVSNQPWPSLSAPSADFQAVHLGSLVLYHVFLSRDGTGGYNLSFQRWRFSADGWKASPRINGSGRLIELIWRPCQDEEPDLITLVAQPDPARILPMPFTLGDRTFDREVVYADLPL